MGTHSRPVTAEPVTGKQELAAGERCTPSEIMNWLQMGPGSRKRWKRIVSTGCAGQAPNKAISDAVQSPGRALSHWDFTLAKCWFELSSQVECNGKYTQNFQAVACIVQVTMEPFLDFLGHILPVVFFSERYEPDGPDKCLLAPYCSTLHIFTH